MDARLGVFALALLLPATPAEAATQTSGPVELQAPADAVFARDEQDLVRLVAEGPHDIWLRAATYRTQIVIRRPLALHGLRGARLESASGTVIRIETDDAIVDNVTIHGAGNNFVGEDAGIKAKGERNAVRNVRVEDSLFGIAFEGCHSCLIEGSFVRGPAVHESMRGDGIKLWESHDSIVRKNHVDRVRDVVVWYSRRVVCEDNVVEHSRYGTHFMYAHDSIARRSSLRGNVVGVFVMYSSRLHLEDNVIAGSHGAAGMGVGFKESDGVVVTHNHIIGNTNGIYLDRTPRDPRDRVTFSRNVIGVNDLALRIHGAAKGLGFEKNSFRHNGDLVEVDGGNDATAIDFVGNHWTEYAGYDLDRDGFGDVPFTHGRLSTAIVQDHAAVRFFHGTVALQLVDAIAKAFPLLEKQAVLVDPKPAMEGER
ncbi:MAG: nitrous oxide reductase family maturation protein NosD [Polyangiales bacterium]